jgi:hypothetical protein
VSFVTFSLGGLIARASFPHLEFLKQKFHSFISLSSPHLGYMFNSSKLFDTGMWFMKQWSKSPSLIELSMSDADQPNETLMFKMSKWPGLNWF